MKGTCRPQLLKPCRIVPPASEARCLSTPCAAERVGISRVLTSGSSCYTGNDEMPKKLLASVEWISPGSSSVVCLCTGSRRSFGAHNGPSALSWYMRCAWFNAAWCTGPSRTLDWFTILLCGFTERCCHRLCLFPQLVAIHSSGGSPHLAACIHLSYPLSLRRSLCPFGLVELNHCFDPPNACCRDSIYSKSHWQASGS